MSPKNRQVLLASRPSGEPTADNFRLAEAEVPEPGPGQMLLRTIYLSLDPYIRGRMNAGPSYAPPGEVGAVMEGRAVAEVVKSNLPGYQPGDVVFAPTAGRSTRWPAARRRGSSTRRSARSPTPSACSACRA
jgi:NADPH-dependent curcumin reductase CurA